MSFNNSQPWNTRVTNKGTPGDFFRGYGVSYAYLRDGEILPVEDIRKMINYKSNNDFRSASLITADADTVVWKYSWNKNVFDQDAKFTLYRAAGVHLWLAEVYIYWAFERNGIVSTFTTNAANIVNDGSNYSASSSRLQRGVRGRVGFGDGNDVINVGNINYVHDPFTNEVIDYINLSGNFSGLQELLEDKIMDEKARELAFEGERFYDLMRAAKRRNDPSYLAKIVSQKYPAGKRTEIYNLLLNEANWHIKYFD